MSEPALLSVDRLSVEYRGKGLRKNRFLAVQDASISVPHAKTLGLVGESGSGKTTIGRAILGLAPVSKGNIVFDGQNISRFSRSERRNLSRDLQVIFQDPYSSLNPSMTVGEILAEPLLVVKNGDRKQARKRITELLDQVGLPSNAYERLPREFSGGQRQRVAIARALALSPRFIVCDEPVSALDLTTQATVLDLLLTIQQDTGVAYLFISHDLDVVRHMSHHIAVIKSGVIVEQGSAQRVVQNPVDPYTQKLLLASPVPDPERQAVRRAERQRFLALNPSSDQFG